MWMCLAISSLMRGNKAKSLMVLLLTFLDSLSVLIMLGFVFSRKEIELNKYDYKGNSLI